MALFVLFSLADLLLLELIRGDKVACDEAHAVVVHHLQVGLGRVTVEAGDACARLAIPGCL